MESVLASLALLPADESDLPTAEVETSFSGAFLSDSWPLTPVSLASLAAPLGTGLRSTVGVTLGCLGLLGVFGGVFFGLDEASNTLILSEMGVRPSAVRRDMAALGALVQRAGYSLSS